MVGQAGFGHARLADLSHGLAPDAKRFDVGDSNPPAGHLNHSSMFECLQRTLDHLSHRSDHCCYRRTVSAGIAAGIAKVF
jgi:hypothetical protein